MNLLNRCGIYSKNELNKKGIRAIDYMVRCTLAIRIPFIGYYYVPDFFVASLQNTALIAANKARYLTQTQLAC